MIDSNPRIYRMPERDMTFDVQPNEKDDEEESLLALDVPKTPKPIRPLIAGAVLLVALIAIGIAGPADVGEQLLYMWEEEPGPVSGLIFAAFYAVAAIFFIPAVILAIGAGFLFGGIWGSVIAVTCRPLGGLLSFLISRYVAYDYVQRWIEGWERFETIDELASKNPLRVVFLMRLVPVIPFNLANYVFGLTRVDWKRYTVASALGVAPGTLFYVYLGVIAGDLTRALTMEDAPGITPAYFFWFFGAMALLVLLAFLIQLGRKKWLKLIDEKAPPTDVEPPHSDHDE